MSQVKLRANSSDSIESIYLFEEYTTTTTKIPIKCEKNNFLEKKRRKRDQPIEISKSPQISDFLKLLKKHQMNNLKNNFNELNY